MFFTLKPNSIVQEINMSASVTNEALGNFRFLFYKKLPGGFGIFFATVNESKGRSCGEYLVT